MSFDPFKELLDIPAVFVEISNLECSERPVVREKDIRPRHDTSPVAVCLDISSALRLCENESSGHRGYRCGDPLDGNTDGRNGDSVLRG